MDSSDPRPELLVAALFYLVTAHARTQCFALGSCIARHFTCLARHPEAHRLIRDVGVVYGHEWEATACASRGGPSQSAAVLEPALH
ncbi:MAG: hypothetical protein V4637_00870 [Pseudomonadota bacterium]